MPNHVTHKLLFSKVIAQEIFDTVCPDGRFDFEKLIPSPIQVYHGDISAEDEKDFSDNWYSWNVKNWGTKWGAYETSQGIEDDQAFIKFDTAWSIPYPIISAFANMFKIPFEHRYFDEGSNFWGIEKWDKDNFCEKIHRVSKSKNTPEEKRLLCIELKGYDPDKEEDIN